MHKRSLSFILLSWNSNKRSEGEKDTIALMSYLLDNTVPNIAIYENIERKCYPIHDECDETGDIAVTSKLKQEMFLLRQFNDTYSYVMYKDMYHFVKNI